MTIDCGALQDRMPDVAAGVSSWSAGEAAHLPACEECGPEWEIVQTARRLGVSSARQVDTAKLSANVVADLRAGKARTRVVRGRWVGAIAAAAVLLLMVSIYVPPSRRAAEPTDTTAVAMTPVTGAIPMAELDALDADQLEAVLEHLDGAAGAGSTGGVPSMGDLDDQQLERVLRSLEG